MDTPPLLVASAAAASALAVFVFAKRNAHRPPGPSPKPIIGNLLDMPKEHEWLTFHEWAKTYGDCMFISILGQPILILNSHKVASELLEKRSVLYSSRPHLVMAGDLVGFDQALALMPYSERSRQLRRLMQRELSSSALQKYWHLHEKESRTLIKNVLTTPDNLFWLIRHYAGSVILKVTYGYQTKAENDPFLLLAEQVMDVFSKASQPGAWLVDIVPWMKNIPAWAPGGSFHSTADRWRKLHMQVIEGPYDWAKANQESPELIEPNFTSTVLQQNDHVLSTEEEEILLWSSASLFGGGADTTVSAISSFFLVMSLHPAVQKRGQEEIDRVIGHERLPSVTDRASLPYVECIMYEIMRWNPVTPLCVPHLLVEDDVYEGYHIPAKTIVMPNVWSMLHNADIFPEPHAFKPERFLHDDSAVKELGVAFGFGRRACPGVHFAEASMFVAIATALATCDIQDARDETGMPVSPEVQYKTGTISHPPSFNCSITPRDGSAVDLLDG